VSPPFLVEDRLKGVPLGTPPFPIERIAEREWNVLRGDVRLPVALLRESTLRANGTWMRRFLQESGALLAPHGKTTMSPELFQRQLADGAWGITFANMGQVRAARLHGIARIVLANIVMDPAEVRWATDELRRDPAFEMLFLVDSLDSVLLLAREVERESVGRPLGVLIEQGYPGGRTGSRSVSEALLVARAVASRRPHLALRGVSAFEGLLGSGAEAETRVVAFLDSLVETAQACDREGLFCPGPTVLSAGGSAFFDVAAERLGKARLAGGSQLLIRSGCYLTQDGGPYERAFARILDRSETARSLGPGLRPALELWGQVLSRPEPTRVVVNLGKRDASHDLGLPRPFLVHRAGAKPTADPLPGVTTWALNDQHALLDVDADLVLRPGDRIGFSISHPCLTFDRWPLLFVVDDAYQVISAVHTLF
jgi:D-serine deaminase-like pyridoxal phosphate-dependent protein